MDAHWWQKAVVYQIYPRSFCDSNGDGIGDIPGIISKLDYIRSLGVDAIWLSPVFKSPQDDNGYDISDYMDIDPMFGTLDDMRTLIREAKARGMQIIMDMVLNHSSDEHPWFLESKKDRVNPKSDWYVWRDGEPGTPPNDLRACFGGSAWQWVEERQQYYLHQYSVKQPDLNWDNPDVRHALYDMMKWWIAQGVGGFRFDVIDSIAKEPDRKVIVEGTNLHPYIREMSEEVFHGQDLLTVGEVWSANAERAKVWANPDGSELSMVFLLEHFSVDQQPWSKWDIVPMQLTRLKKIIGSWQQAIQGEAWCALAWENHDVPRIVSRWGNDGEYRALSAEMLATVLYGLQGTPFLYQGEEIAMTNAPYSIEEYQDIEIHNLVSERRANGESEDAIMHMVHAKGRDNARTPMQWDNTVHSGFTTGTPWLKVNPNYTEINVADQEQDRYSVLNYYRYLIELRKRENVFFSGEYRDLLPDSEEVFAYARESADGKLTVLANFTDRDVALAPEVFADLGEALIGNYPTWPENAVLRPYEAAMYLKK